MELFTHDVRKIKDAADKNGLKNATCNTPPPKHFLVKAALVVTEHFNVNVNQKCSFTRNKKLIISGLS